MHNQITDKCLAVAPDFQFSKWVCKSQNRKCVFKSQNTMQNVSVCHKIENVSVSHIREFLRGADREVLTMVCDGPNWFQMVYMKRHYH